MVDGRPSRRLRVASTYVPIVLVVCAMVYASGFGIRSWDDFRDAFRPAAGPVLAPLVVAVFIGFLNLRVSRKLSDLQAPCGLLDRVAGPRARAGAWAELYAQDGPELEAVHELELLLAEVETWERSSAPARAAKRLHRVVKQGRIIRRRIDIETRRDAA